MSRTARQAAPDGAGESGGRPWFLTAAMLAIAAIVVVMLATSSSGDDRSAAPTPAPSDPGDDDDSWITFPEGLTVDQMADRLSDRRPDLDPQAFVDAATTARPPEVFDRPPGISTPEGLLFPNTYRVEGPDDEADLVDQMLGLATRIAGEEQLTAGAAELGVSPYEVMIIASMIEKEAGTEDDRALISRVIHNRLGREMLLQIDATLYYGNDDSVPFSELREIDSPYNTYERLGLPPTPISNPGQASIHAALNPAADPLPDDPLCPDLPEADCAWLFYVLADEDGSHAFTVTYEQHLAEVDKARDAGLL